LEGSLDRDEAVMLHRTLTFTTHTADEVMTPRVRAATLPITATAADVIAACVNTGHSRFPVEGTGIDDIVGVVHVKSAYGIDFEQRFTVPVTQLMTTPLKVPESAGVGSLLGVLRGRGYQIAVVVDEHGGTAGIVTLEDLVEELLGEVHDEHDKRLRDIVVLRESIMLSGALRPDEVLVRTGIRIPEGDEYETIAGYVLEQLERIPIIGEEVRTENGKLRVERLTRSRIDRLRYIPDDITTDPAFAGARERILDRFEHDHSEKEASK